MKTRIMNYLSTPVIALAGVLAFYAVAVASLEHQNNKPRLTCEDLGRCNLKTGEVYSYDPVANAQMVYLFGDDGEEL